MEISSDHKKWSILMIISISTFMATLDGSIVNVALPKMARVLNVSTASIQLVSTSYLIIIASIILIFGRLGDLYGKIKLFKYGLVFFTAGSLLCGLSNTFEFLILARVIQAAGAAVTMANTQGIVAEVFPPKERGKAMGLTGSAVALGSLVGPGLGGIIVGMTSWEYIFLINVPVGLIALYYSFKLLPKDNTLSSGKLDGLGSGLFVLTIVPLFAALNAAVNRGFTDPLVLLGFVIAILALSAFYFFEKKLEYPLINFQIFENKLFTLSIVTAYISFVASFCNFIILPFYLQDVMGYQPQQAGLIMMLYPLILLVVAPASGYLADKIGSEILTLIGLSLISLALFEMATLTENSSLMIILLFIGVLSIGSGLFQSPNNVLVMSTVSRDRLGVAGSINALVRNLGMVSGISVATTVLYGMMSRKVGQHVTTYIAGRSDVFIYGMKAVYITAGAICLFGALLTLARFVSMKLKTNQ